MRISRCYQHPDPAFVAFGKSHSARRTETMPPNETLTSMRTRIRLFAAASALVALTALSACATPGQGAGSAPGVPIDPTQLAATTPAAPTGEVIGQGMLREDEDGAVLCLGGIAESYPPQCSGIPVTGFSWDDIDGDETASEVTWGMYLVQGTFDGQGFAITQPPIMLALVDQVPFEDPTDGKNGAASEADLLRIQDEVSTALSSEILGSYPDNGWLHISVVWDDGTIQDAVNSVYGEDSVIVHSALRPAN